MNIRENLLTYSNTVKELVLCEGGTVKSVNLVAVLMRKYRIEAACLPGGISLINSCAIDQIERNLLIPILNNFLYITAIMTRSDCHNGYEQAYDLFARLSTQVEFKGSKWQAEEHILSHYPNLKLFW